MMKVHLIRTEDVDEELFAGVISLLQAIPGRMQFIGDPDIPRREYRLSENRSNAYYSLHKVQWDQGRKISPSVGSGQFDPPAHAVHWDKLFAKSNMYREARNLDRD